MEIIGAMKRKSRRIGIIRKKKMLIIAPANRNGIPGKNSNINANSGENRNNAGKIAAYANNFFFEK
jgi:hypothetical protein